MKACGRVVGIQWLVVLTLSCLCLVHASVSGAAAFEPVSLLHRLWQYEPELPKALLDASQTLVGNTVNLQRFLSKLVTGQPTKIVLMGGSLSLRGWNSPDQTYMKQVHKWLELVARPGCAEEVAARRAAHSAQSTTDTGAKEQADTDEAQSGPSESEGGRMGEPVKVRPAEGKVIHRGPVFEEQLHQSPDPHYQNLGHLCSQSKVELVMLAVPAAGPGYAERCVLPRVPADTDLLVLDWACNDIVKADRLSHPERHALERILRTVLSLTPQPAVLMFQAYSWFQSAGTFVGFGKSGHNLAQDKHTLLAEYYGSIQVVSARAALYQLMAATNDTVNRLVHLGRAERSVSDLLHVTNYGHRWYADLLINFFRDHMHNLALRSLAAQALRSQHHPAEAQQQRVVALLDPASSTSSDTQNFQQACWGSGPAVLSSQNEAEGQASQRRCVIQGTLGTDYPVIVSGPGRLKPPFFRGNEADPGGVCAIGPDFRSVVTESQDWEWRDDGRPGQPKLGYVTQQANVPLVVSLGVLRTGGRSSRSEDVGGSVEVRERSRNMRAWLVYLTSWRGMGLGHISCAGGCVCANSTVNADNKDTLYKTSVPALHGFTLAQRSMDTPCLVQVVLLPGPPGGPDADTLPARFKVMGVTTSTAPVWHLSEVMKKGLSEVTAQAEREAAEAASAP